MMLVPCVSARVQELVDAGPATFAAASACQVYVDPGEPQPSTFGGLTPRTVLRVIGPSCAVRR